MWPHSNPDFPKRNPFKLQGTVKLARLPAGTWAELAFCPTCPEQRQLTISDRLWIGPNKEETWTLVAQEMTSKNTPCLAPDCRRNKSTIKTVVTFKLEKPGCYCTVFRLMESRGVIQGLVLPYPDTLTARFGWG